jgi:hypothetical protein
MLTLGMLGFDDSRRATLLLAAQLLAAPGSAWTREVAVLERHASGRLSLRGTFGGDFFADPEAGGAGDVREHLAAGTLTGALVGALTGPAGAAVGGNIGSALGRLLGVATPQGTHSVYQLLRTSLPRGSSALLLLADEALVDQMVREGGATASRVVRHGVGVGPQRQLEALLQRGRAASGASAAP